PDLFHPARGRRAYVVPPVRASADAGRAHARGEPGGAGRADRRRASAVVRRRQAERALPAAVADHRVPRPAGLHRAEPGAGDAGGQHRPDAGALPGQAAGRARRLEDRLEPGMNTGDRGEEMDDAMGRADAALLDELQVMWEKADPVPPGLVERVTFAIGLDNLDVEMMRLTEEVLVPAGARGTEHVRTITFGGESVTVMVTVSQDGQDGFRLD